MGKTSKKMRVLHIFERLNQGKLIDKTELANKFEVSNKAIQRDINDLRSYFSEFHKHDLGVEVSYNRKKGGYLLSRDESSWLNKREILAISKILLESRAFIKDEIDQLLDKLVLSSAPSDRDKITEVIKNENFHYNPIKNKESLFDIIWDLSQAIRAKNYLELSYQKESSSQSTTRRLKPVGLIFSEYYFYLLAYIDNRDYEFPTVYRLDRITDYEIDKQADSFNVPYLDRFEEGEFRKRVQFMYTGELMKLKFKFWGSSLEAVLDRLPTAKVVEERDECHIIEAEVYGKGIKIWLLSQGANLEVLQPEGLRQELEDEITNMKAIYCTS
ncbi:MAG: helix-turn-helix transcriptional regulator [Bacillota bacterium]